MRKLLTFMVAVFMATGLMSAASDVIMADFESGSAWGGWGGVTNTIVANPYPSASYPVSQVEKVVEDAAKNYGSAAKWVGSSFISTDYQKITVDVYAEAATNVQLYMDNSASGAANYTQQKSATVGAWTTLEYDITTLAAYDYKQIAFQFTATGVTVYFDNVKIIAKPAAPPTGLLLTTPISTVNVGKKIQLSVTVDPVTSNSNVTYTSSNTAVATVSASGIVTALTAGSVDVSAISTIAPTVGDTVSLTVTAPEVANSLVVATFENGLVNYEGAWNGKKNILADNPSKTGINTSDKVMKVDSCMQWDGLAFKSVDWNKYTKVKFKVYTDSSDFGFQVGINNVGGTSVSYAPAAGTWTEYVYDVTCNPAANQQFFFQRTGAGKSAAPGYAFYIDDIVYIAGNASDFIPLTALDIQGSGSVNAITADNGTLQMEAIFAPATATNKSIASWSLVNQNADTATLSATGLLKAVRNANVKVKAVSVDGSFVAEKVIAITGQKVGVDSIKIKPFSIAFPDTLTTNGASVRIDTIVKFYPKDATKQTIKWSVKGQTKNTVSADGLFEAFADGITWVIAVSDTNATAKDSIKIVVSGQQLADSVVIDGPNDSILVNGGTMQLSNTVYPTTTRIKMLNWSVSNAKASVSASGLVTALDNGDVWVKATTTDGSNKTDSFKITMINQVSADSIVISGGNTITKDDSTLTLSTTVYPANVSNKSVIWSIISNDADTATISATGVITPKRNGTIVVKAVAVANTAKIDTLVVTITGQIVPLESIRITASSDSIKVNNGTLQMNAIFTPGDPTNKNVTWSISSVDADTASISATGLVTAIRNGKVTVKVTSAQSATILAEKTLTLVNQLVEVTSIKLVDTVLITKKGGTVQLAPVLAPADASDKNITYSVSDNTIASVSATGLITALKSGETFIKAVTTDGGFADSVKVITSNQSPFNIVTFEGDVPAGSKIVTINGKKYLQVVLNGWNSSFGVQTFKLRPGYTATCELKYSLCKATDDTLDLSNINGGINLQDTINKIKNPWGEGMVPSATSLTQSPVTGSLGTASAAMSADMKLINQIQYFGQQKISWGPTIGDTIWVSPISFVSNNPVVLDPAEVDPTDLPKGITIATIGDTKYFQVVLNGWNSYMSIIPVTLNSGLTAECSIKYSLCKASDDTLDLANINGGINLQDTVNKVKNPWGEGMVPSSMSLTQSPVTGSLGDASGLMSADMKLINQIQFFGQQKISWGATIGDTIWISKITLKDKAAPTKPAALAAVADKSTVNLTWEASTDNVKLVGYIVSQGSVALDTVTALKFSVADLKDGDYTFSVVALDASGNKSAAATATVSITVNVAGSELANVTVYPNPVVNVLRISGNANFKSVVIFNLDGKIVNRLENVASNSEVNVSGLSSGMYMIRMTSASNAVVTKQFVKR